MHRLRPLFRVSFPRNFVHSKAEPGSDKEALMRLRRNTGYSYVNCRKALNEFGREKLSEAESWLRNLARKEGWEKATALGNRRTNQGLVATITEGNLGAIVEVNCETDFVSKSFEFRSLVETVAKSGLRSIKNRYDSISADNKGLIEIIADVNELQNEKGERMPETLAMAVNLLQENLQIPRVLLYTAPKDALLTGYAHPKSSCHSVPMGHFCSLVAFRRTTDQLDGLFPSDKLGLQLCQHIVGMNPKTLGTALVSSDDTPKSNEKTDYFDDDHDDDSEFCSETTNSTEFRDEDALLRQDFMLSPKHTVFDYITGHCAEIIDFVRIQCAENKPE